MTPLTKARREELEAEIKSLPDSMRAYRWASDHALSIAELRAMLASAAMADVLWEEVKAWRRATVRFDLTGKLAKAVAATDALAARLGYTGEKR